MDYLALHERKFSLLVSHSKGPIKCVYFNNYPRQARTTFANINSDETFLPSGNCNTADDPYARACVSNKRKNMNVKVFNVKSKWSKFSVQHESRECRCELNKSVCNSK